MCTLVGSQWAEDDHVAAAFKHDSVGSKPGTELQAHLEETWSAFRREGEVPGTDLAA